MGHAPTKILQLAPTGTGHPACAAMARLTWLGTLSWKRVALGVPEMPATSTTNALVGWSEVSSMALGAAIGLEAPLATLSVFAPPHCAPRAYAGPMLAPLAGILPEAVPASKPAQSLRNLVVLSKPCVMTPPCGQPAGRWGVATPMVHRSQPPGGGAPLPPSNWQPPARTPSLWRCPTQGSLAGWLSKAARREAAPCKLWQTLGTE